jgi:SAM-dependent methyltransferase
VSQPTVVDRGRDRVLTVDGVEHVTRYSERLVRMLIERKGPARTALYFRFKETRGAYFLSRLLDYLTRRGTRGLRVLEVGCSFGHITEYLHEQPVVAEICTFDVDKPFVDITRVKVEELSLSKVRRVDHFTDEETTRLPFDDGAFDLVLAIGVIEHLPARERHRFVDEYYRVLAPSGHIAILDTPNRAFPLETHSVGLPGIQWMPAPLAYRYARLARPARVKAIGVSAFSEGAYRNAAWRECMPSAGVSGLVDVTEEAGYGYRFFRDTAVSRTRRALLPLFAVAAALLSAAGRSPSLALPYFNLVFRKAA